MHANTFFLRWAPSACERPIRVVLLPSPAHREEGSVGRTNIHTDLAITLGSQNSKSMNRAYIFILL